MNVQQTNVVARTLVWLGFLSWWLYLKKPEGSSLMRWRSGVPTVAGVVLAAAGAAVYVWAARTLARAVPGTLEAPAALLTRGPYRYVRNPLYLAAAAVFAGVATLYVPWRPLDVVTAGLVAALVHLFVVRREEPATRRRLGSAYDEYCTSVPRWIPKLPPRV